jgi:hypothetical protein
MKFTNPFKKPPLAPLPRKQFMDDAKNRFLAAFDAQYGVRSAPRAMHRMAGWAKGLIVAGAFAAVMVSVSAYADNANVPADSPLYPLKRLSEDVQLALTPASGQAQFEVTLATRRANEIQDLSVRKPSSTLIAGLSVDFENAVSSSLGHVGVQGVAHGSTTQASGNVVPTALGSPSPTICSQVESVFLNSTEAKLQISDNPDLLKRFEDRCGQSVGERVVATGTVNVIASTTIMVMPATIPGMASSTPPGEHVVHPVLPPAINVPIVSSSANGAHESGGLDLRAGSGIVAP